MSDTENAKEELSFEEQNELDCEEALTTEKFCFTYKLRFNDLLRFNIRNSMLGLENLFFWLSLIIIAAYSATSWGSMKAQGHAILIVLLVLLIWLVPVRAVLNAVKGSLVLHRDCTDTDYHVCENGFVICQDGMRSFLAYKKIREIKETKTRIYAKVFKNSGFIFPKDLVGVYFDELRAILTDRVARKKK